ncbi:alpha/beta-hydrolase [Schizopora paradoxa]|uniref:Alpha/beta-hydrolase n=1 Tax=Schizopora paradoxa TaxID=27342 RepID=A0A0H2R7S0_9AGAM|nr:alpha/beta-hydrolase [Schizopora paradoxa]
MMSSSIFSLRRQPFKGIYTCFAIVRLLGVLLPWWTICNLLPAWRPRRTWYLSWCLKNNFQRHANGFFQTIGFVPSANTLDLRPEVLGLEINAIPPDLIRGKLKEWAGDAGVFPVRIPGYWMHGPNTNFTLGEHANPSEGKVLYYLHGGGYVAFSAHPDSMTSAIPRSILQQCAELNVKRAFNVEYRLSSHDPNPRENPFPAALLDALAGYAYLVNDVGFAPKDIIIAGDSAGGNLAIAMVRYLLEEPEASKLVPPGGLILLSPWSDLGNSSSEDMHNTMHTNVRTDYMAEPEILPDGHARREYFQHAFAGPHGVEFLDANAYVSPASLLLKDEDVRFEGFPPAFVAYGSGELFAGQIRTLVRRMKHDMGDRVVEYEAEDGVHDYMLIGWQERNQRDTLSAIEQWVKTIGR